jgi:hypothetical protein
MMAAAALAGAGWHRAWKIHRAIVQEMDWLRVAALASTPQRIDWSSIDEAPRPVAEYLRHALGRNGSHVRLAQLHQSGYLRTDGRSRRWMHFDAEQMVGPRTSSFIWNASVDVVGPIGVRVVDALTEEGGSGRVYLQSAWPIAKSDSGLEMNSGALHRFLAESVWYPNALLPSHRLRWEQLDDRRAVANLSTELAAVSLEFQFNERAEVIGVYSPGRWGTFGGRFRKVPWKGRFGDYCVIQGLRVPLQGEVAWELDGRWGTVWRGRLTRVRYQR